MGLYEEAIRLSREHGFIQNEGLTHECAARLCAARGWQTISSISVRSRKTPRAGMAEDFREPRLRLWEQGRHKGADLLIRIRKLGYIGSLRSLNRFLTPWRAAKHAA